MDNTEGSWFTEARYGLFIHFGLYSQLQRGEWVMNREKIPPEALRRLAADWRPEAFDAGSIADLAVAGGMRYLVYTTMHHDGFRMYDSELTDFSAAKQGPQRDFVAEIISAARERGLKVGLYHSLNNWFDAPDAVEALENTEAYGQFMENTFSRIRELVTRYNPIDILWYDGWWPFNSDGWQAEKMNAMVRGIQPHILLNGRNGLPGDFATPEQHIAAPDPWRPWEACLTLNDNWGFHIGDHNWKSSREVIKSLVRAAQGNGNILLNIGPRGDGSIPGESVRVIHEVGDWLRINRECVSANDLWTIDPLNRGDHRGDFCNHGPFTISGHNLYLVATSLPPSPLTLTGLEMKVEGVTRLGVGELPFRQQEGTLWIDDTGPSVTPKDPPPVFRISCDRPPLIYNTGGMRVPNCEHPRYDPIQPDIDWW